MTIPVQWSRREAKTRPVPALYQTKNALSLVELVFFEAMPRVAEEVAALSQYKRCEKY